MRTPDVKDPLTGRSFDGRYDDALDCGCVIFYHGGRVPCSRHQPLNDFTGRTGSIRQQEIDAALLDDGPPKASR